MTPAAFAAVLTDTHARVVRAYEALENGDVEFASDVLHDLACELAERRAACDREAA